MTIINTDYFVTDNLGLLAFCLCNSCTLVSITASPDIANKLLFSITPYEIAKNLEQEYYSYKAKVTPQSYYHALQEAKRLLIAYKNNH